MTGKSSTGVDDQFSAEPNIPTDRPLTAGEPLTKQTRGMLCDGDLLRETFPGGRTYQWFYPSDIADYRLASTLWLGRPDADGWIEWHGGENPVPGEIVEVKIRWRQGEPSEGSISSENMEWHHVAKGHGDGGDIIAYRLSRPPSVSADPVGGVTSGAGEGGSSEADYGTLSDLHTIKGWLHGLATAHDLADIVADGGVSVGDCYQQEAREFAGRLGRCIAALTPSPPVQLSERERALVERAECQIRLGRKTGADGGGTAPHNIYVIAADLLAALTRTTGEGS